MAFASLEKCNGTGGSVYAEVKQEQYVSADYGMPGDVVGSEGCSLDGRGNRGVQPGYFYFGVEEREYGCAGYSAYGACSGFWQVQPPGYAALLARTGTGVKDRDGYIKIDFWGELNGAINEDGTYDFPREVVMCSRNSLTLRLQAEVVAVNDGDTVRVIPKAGKSP